MCDECGCETITVEKSVMEANDKIAHKIWHDLKDKHIFCINIMGSPGSGKTTIIEGMLEHISPKEVCIIQGDLESDVDKKRLEPIVDVYQINTHSGCHLNANMIKNILTNINLENKKYLIIENVGNLVCPTGVKLGQHLNLLVSSTTEGSDKPKKYPPIFTFSDVIVISKSDLIPYTDFNLDNFLDDIKYITKAKIFKSSKDKESLKELSQFLTKKYSEIMN